MEATLGQPADGQQLHQEGPGREGLPWRPWGTTGWPSITSKMEVPGALPAASITVGGRGHRSGEHITSLTRGPASAWGRGRGCWNGLQVLWPGAQETSVTGPWGWGSLPNPQLSPGSPAELTPARLTHGKQTPKAQQRGKVAWPWETSWVKWKDLL